MRKEKPATGGEKCRRRQETTGRREGKLQLEKTEINETKIKMEENPGELKAEKKKTAAGVH